LPEAELDRFLLKLHVPYPAPSEEAAIVRAAVSGQSGSASSGVTATAGVTGVTGARVPVLTAEDLALIRADVDSVRCDDALVAWLVALVASTRPLADAARSRRPREDYLKYLSFGASPRASIALCRCARIRAFFEGRDFVIPEDIKAAAPAVLRHRLVLSYEAGADGLSADDIIAKVLGIVPLP